MVNPKDFMTQFLQYLQSYYGGRGESLKGMSPVANLLRMPIFQEGLEEVDAQPPGMGMGGEPQGMMGSEMGMADQLNGLFPGPHDPMRLN